MKCILKIEGYNHEFIGIVIKTIKKPNILMIEVILDGNRIVVYRTKDEVTFL